MSISRNQKPIDTGLGARPEADEILDGIDLSGKTVLVTGGYSGIGLETVRALVKAGAHVHVPARRKAQARDMLDGIIAPEQIGDMDLGDLPSVEKFAADFLSQHDKLDILIGNAAVMACPMAHTAQGFESQIGINHFGHFTLIKGLMPALKNAGQADGARVVLLSSKTALMINGNPMANQKPPKPCKQSSWTHVVRAITFAVFPCIRAAFSRRCNAICKMRKWSRWAGPMRMARLLRWPPQALRAPRKARAQPYLPPPHPS